MAKYKIVQRVKTPTDYDYLFPYSPWQIHECVEQETSTSSSIVISTGLSSTIVPNTFVAMYYSSHTNTANATITVDSKGAIPIKNGTGNIEAGIIGSGMYILMLIDYSNSIASVLFSAASIQDIKNKINSLITQITNILNGTLAVGNSNKLNGLISSNFTKSFENITSGSIFDWADSKTQSVMFLCGGPNVTGIPISSTYYNGILFHASNSTKCMILFRRASNGITTQLAIAVKNNNIWTEFFDINAKYALNLISPDGKRVVTLDNGGNITIPGIMTANVIAQNKDNYGIPVEIGPYIDMHKVGSDSDYDIRVAVASEGDLYVDQSINNGRQSGFLITCPIKETILRIRKITQTEYDSLQSKDQHTVYLITG